MTATDSSNRTVARSSSEIAIEDAKLEQAIGRLERFLTHPPIRSSDGGIHSGYDWRTKTCPFVYHEITGYALSVLANSHRWHQDARYVEMAGQTFAYLSDLASDDQAKAAGIPHSRPFSGGPLRRRYYSFDNAIILQGLCDAQNEFASIDAKPLILRVAAWLRDEMQNPDGSFLGYVDEDGQKNHPKHAFEGDRGCLHIKHAIGLLKAGALLKDETLTQAAHRVCEWGLPLLSEAGLFWTNVWKDQVFTHPHCYALEGLLYAAHRTGRSVYLQAAQTGAQALARIQTRAGGLPHTPVDHRQARFRLRSWIFRGCATDATAQAIKIWSAVDLMNGRNDFGEHREKAGEWLLQQQVSDADPDSNRRGGLNYHIRENPFVAKVHRDMNTWPSQFAMGSFKLLGDWRKGAPDLENMMIEWL